MRTSSTIKPAIIRTAPGCRLPDLRQYQVSLSYTEDDNDPVNISFAVNIDSKRKHEGLLIFNRLKVFIDGELPVSETDKCVALSGICIYPIKLGNKNNRSANFEVENIEEIRTRWILSRPQLLRCYEGTFVDKIVERMDDLFDEDSRITKLIEQNIFQQLFFMPLLANDLYPDVASFKQDFSLINFCTPVQFSCRRTLKKLDDGSLTIKVEGECADSRSYSEIVYSKASYGEVDEMSVRCEGKLELSIVQCADENMRSIKGTIEIADGNSFRKLELLIAYNELVRLSQQDFEPLVKEEDNPNKKPFWKLF